MTAALYPAGSWAWKRHGLTTPTQAGWNRHAASSEWTCEVWQSAYGHGARKRTWLYCVGEHRPCDLAWSRNPGTHQVGWFDRKKPTLGKKAASATPPAFRDALLNLARHSRGERRAA